MPQDVKIDFVGIGAPKCASTWIYECLKEHPDLYIAPKDQNDTTFFVNENFEEEIQNYKGYQRNRNKKLGNMEVWYLYNEEAIERIKQHNPQVKLLVLLRNPIKRAYSQYLHYDALRNRDWRNFRDAIEKDYETVVERGFYYKYLREWYSEFPEENILVVFTKNIKDNQLDFIQNIFEFLEVDSEFEPETVSHKIAPTAFKLTKLGKFIHKGIGQPLKRSRFGRTFKNFFIIRRTFHRLAEKYSESKNLSKPPMKEEDRKYLHNVYEDDIEKLEDLTGEDLSPWKEYGRR